MRKEINFGHDFYTYLVESDSLSYFEIVSPSNAKFLKKAIKIEINLILKNQTWKLLNLSPITKPIGYKCIFKRKLNFDDLVDKNKVRLVIKGFKQKTKYRLFWYICTSN